MTAPTCLQIWEEDEAYEHITEKLTGTWRHGTEHDIVVRHKESGKFYCASYRRDKDGDYNELREGEAAICEVKPVEITRVEYVAARFPK